MDKSAKNQIDHKTIIKMLDEFDNYSTKFSRNAIPDDINKSILWREGGWLMRGLFYHMRSLIIEYFEFGFMVKEGLEKKADIISIYATNSPNFTYPLHSIVFLSKIALDKLRDFLAPTFITPYNQLPKSITGFAKGNTDCPIYKKIFQDNDINYLIDLRNCYMHYRPMICSDTAHIYKEDTDESLFEELENIHKPLGPLARAYYRIDEGDKIVFNMYLPDKIFDRTGSNKSLAKFSYSTKKLLLPTMFKFMQKVSLYIDEALNLMINTKDRVYTYSK
ncbi:MAG: hypothetical protein GX625_11075 [Clostridiaceae bacterium]|nr:hypothetical protein [Clostridiaceae bacterium]